MPQIMSFVFQLKFIKTEIRRQKNLAILSYRNENVFSEIAMSVDGTGAVVCARELL